MTRLLTGALLMGLSTPALAWNPLVNCGSGNYATWSGTTTWQMSRASSSTYYSGLSNADVINAVDQGFQVWSDASCCSSFSHQQGSETSAAYNANDNINAIQFTESSWNSSLGSVNSVIAVTIPQYTTWGSCEITNADQIFNGVGFRFTTTNNPGWNDTDLQSITAHENGHWLGLDHSSSSSATMYASYSGGTGARVLASDDLTAVCTLYPGTCGSQETQCANGIDDDGDGRIDCNDSDCAGTASCACPATGAIACDAQVNGDTGTGTNSVQTWACANWETTGPEAVYSFTSSITGQVTIDLTNLNDDLDLFVTGDIGGSCDANNCQASGTDYSSDEQVVLNANAGQTYDIVVDGWDGASSSFTLSTDCGGVGGTAGTGTSTGTATGTGTGTSTGTSTGTGTGSTGSCAATEVLPCGAQVSSTNVGGPTDVDQYACTYYGHTGAEKVFALTPTTSGAVTIDVTNLSDDLDLIITPDLSGRCDAGTCLAVSGNANTASEQAQFNAVGGTTYMVVVDGWDGAASNFDIAATCASSGGTSGGSGTGTSTGGTSTGTGSGGTTTGGTTTGGTTTGGTTTGGTGSGGSGGSGGGSTGTGTGSTGTDGPTGAGTQTGVAPITGSGGCGCSSTGGGAPAFVLLPLALVALRRREA